ncbi:MAG: hypothetical protein P1U61_05040 [Legionellaceae bacterium]|nr:hypothetical protein [Legionellaceae bacterium]
MDDKYSSSVVSLDTNEEEQQQNLLLLGIFGKRVLTPLHQLQQKIEPSKSKNKQIADPIQKAIIDRLLEAHDIAHKNPAVSESIYESLKHAGYYDEAKNLVLFDKVRREMIQGLLKDMKEIATTHAPSPRQSKRKLPETFLHDQDQLVLDIKKLSLILAPYQTATYLSTEERNTVANYIAICNEMIEDQNTCFQRDEADTSIDTAEIIEICGSKDFENYTYNQQRLALLQSKVEALNLPDKATFYSQKPQQNLKRTSDSLIAIEKKEPSEAFRTKIHPIREQSSAVYLQTRVIAHFKQWDMKPQKPSKFQSLLGKPHTLDKQSAILQALLFLNINSPVSAKQKNGQPKIELQYLDTYLKTILTEGFPDIFSLSANGQLAILIENNNDIARALGLHIDPDCLNPENFDIDALNRLTSELKRNPSTADNPNPLDTPLWHVLKSMKPVVDNEFSMSQKVQSYEEVMNLIKDDRIGQTGQEKLGLNVANAAIQTIRKNKYQLTDNPDTADIEKVLITQTFTRMDPQIKKWGNKHTQKTQKRLSEQCQLLMNGQFKTYDEIRPTRTQTTNLSPPHIVAPRLVPSRAESPFIEELHNRLGIQQAIHPAHSAINSLDTAAPVPPDVFMSIERDAAFLEKTERALNDFEGVLSPLSTEQQAASQKVGLPDFMTRRAGDENHTARFNALNTFQALLPDLFTTQYLFSHTLPETNHLPTIKHALGIVDENSLLNPEQFDLEALEKLYTTNEVGNDQCMTWLVLAAMAIDSSHTLSDNQKIKVYEKIFEKINHNTHISTTLKDAFENKIADKVANLRTHEVRQKIQLIQSSDSNESDKIEAYKKVFENIETGLYLRPAIAEDFRKELADKVANLRTHEVRQKIQLIQSSDSNESDKIEAYKKVFENIETGLYLRPAIAKGFQEELVDKIAELRAHLALSSMPPPPIIEHDEEYEEAQESDQEQDIQEQQDEHASNQAAIISPVSVDSDLLFEEDFVLPPPTPQEKKASVLDKNTQFKTDISKILDELAEHGIKHRQHIDSFTESTPETLIKMLPVGFHDVMLNETFDSLREALGISSHEELLDPQHFDLHKLEFLFTQYLQAQEDGNQTSLIDTKDILTLKAMAIKASTTHSPFEKLQLYDSILSNLATVSDPEEENTFTDNALREFVQAESLLISENIKTSSETIKAESDSIEKIIQSITQNESLGVSEKLELCLLYIQSFLNSDLPDGILTSTYLKEIMEPIIGNDTFPLDSKISLYMQVVDTIDDDDEDNLTEEQRNEIILVLTEEAAKLMGSNKTLTSEEVDELRADFVESILESTIDDKTTIESIRNITQIFTQDNTLSLDLRTTIYQHAIFLVAHNNEVLSSEQRCSIISALLEDSITLLATENALEIDTILSLINTATDNTDFSEEEIHRFYQDAVLLIKDEHLDKATEVALTQNILEASPLIHKEPNPEEIALKTYQASIDSVLSDAEKEWTYDTLSPHIQDPLFYKLPLKTEIELCQKMIAIAPHNADWINTYLQFANALIAYKPTENNEEIQALISDIEALIPGDDEADRLQSNSDNQPPPQHPPAAPLSILQQIQSKPQLRNREQSEIAHPPQPSKKTIFSEIAAGGHKLRDKTKASEHHKHIQTKDASKVTQIIEASNKKNTGLLGKKIQQITEAGDKISQRKKEITIMSINSETYSADDNLRPYYGLDIAQKKLFFYPKQGGDPLPYILETAFFDELKEEFFDTDTGNSIELSEGANNEDLIETVESLTFIHATPQTPTKIQDEWAGDVITQPELPALTQAKKEQCLKQGLPNILCIRPGIPNDTAYFAVEPPAILKPLLPEDFTVKHLFSDVPGHMSETSQDIKNALNIQSVNDGLNPQAFNQDQLQSLYVKDQSSTWLILEAMHVAANDTLPLTEKIETYEALINKIVHNTRLDSEYQSTVALGLLDEARTLMTAAKKSYDPEILPIIERIKTNMETLGAAKVPPASDTFKARLQALTKNQPSPPPRHNRPESDGHDDSPHSTLN